MKAYGGMYLQFHIFFTSALDEGEWSVSWPCRLTPRERALGIHCIEGWLDRRAGLEDAEKIPDPLGTRTPILFSSSPYPVGIHTVLSRLHFQMFALNTQRTLC
jgi:hypothetical protein